MHKPKKASERKKRGASGVVSYAATQMKRVSLWMRVSFVFWTEFSRLNKYPLHTAEMSEGKTAADAAAAGGPAGAGASASTGVANAGAAAPTAAAAAGGATLKAPRLPACLNCGHVNAKQPQVQDFDPKVLLCKKHDFSLDGINPQCTYCQGYQNGVCEKCHMQHPFVWPYQDEQEKDLQTQSSSKCCVM